MNHCWIAAALAGLLILWPDSPAKAETFPRWIYGQQSGEGEEGESEEIETDRDSFTPAVSTTPLGRVMVESAWSYIDNRAVPDTNSLPELVTRYGVTDWLEMRLGWNWEAGGASNAISGSVGDPEEEMGPEIEYESQLFYGGKALLTSQRGWTPQSSVIVQAGTPTSGKETATQLVTTYVFGWETPNRWKWDTAMRYGFDAAEGDHFNIWAPSTVLKAPVGERWNVHGEYFSIISQGRETDTTQHYFSPGVHYLVTPDLEVGVRLGWGLNHDAANFFSNVGFGWQY
ncbi:MAG: transporter [Pirellulaceae bacterium]